MDAWASGDVYASYMGRWSIPVAVELDAPRSRASYPTSLAETARRTLRFWST